MKENTSGQDKISVIIPVYNDEKELLVPTIKTVLRQTHQNFEIIVVDDGSPLPIEEKLEGLDQRIAYYKIQHANANVARNHGINKSTGDYIAMLDADDAWLEDHLEKCLKSLKESGADGSYGGLYFTREHGVRDENEKMIARALREGESMIDYLLETVTGAQTSTYFTTAQSAKGTMWDPELIDHQDYDFIVRFERNYKLIAREEEPTTIYYLVSNRKQHYESCIAFTENNLRDIDPMVYTSYNLRMFGGAVEVEAPQKFVDYFRREATKHCEFLSFRLYLSIRDPKTKWAAWLDKLRYLWRIYRVKVEL